MSSLISSSPSSLNMSTSSPIYIVKRNGSSEPMRFDRISDRIIELGQGLQVDGAFITMSIINSLKSGMKTSEIDTLAAETSFCMSTYNPDYDTLASRMYVSNLHKSTLGTYQGTLETLRNNCNKMGENISLIDEAMYVFAKKHIVEIESMIKYARDYTFTYFGLKTLDRSYLQKSSIDGTIYERPQHLFMRVALGIHYPRASEYAKTTLTPQELEKEAMSRVFSTYEGLSLKKFTHATPTLFNSGTKTPQFSSCFLAGTRVYTTNGVKNIEEVVVGDHVVTHKGNIKEVQQLHINKLKNGTKNRKVHELTVEKSPSIKVTGNHKVWALQQVGYRRYNAPQWVSVVDLTDKDYIAIPKKIGGKSSIKLDIMTVLSSLDGYENSEYYDETRECSYETVIYESEIDKVRQYTSWMGENNGNCSGVITQYNSKWSLSINRYWEIDEDFCEFLGIWYGDGCIASRKTTNGRSLQVINIVSRTENTDLIDFVIKIGEKIFGTKPNIYTHKKQNLITITFGSPIISKVFFELFGKGFAGKHLPTFIHELDSSCIKAFISGLISTDGCVAKNLCVNVQLTNPQLMEEIYHLSRSIGVDASIKYITTSSGKIAGKINFPKYAINLQRIKKYYTDDRMVRLKNYTQLSNKTLTFIKDSVSEVYRYIYLPITYGGIQLDDTLFLKINKNKKINDSPELVYTLGIDTDHSYAVEGLVVENCFLFNIADDLDHIFTTLGRTAKISKYSGGLGGNISSIRCKSSLIRSTNGTSDGIIPMIKVYDQMSKYVNQGGKRNGAIAMFLEPWHGDIMDFLDLRLNDGAPDAIRCKNMFLGIWMPDLFMKRLEDNAMWSLMCPDVVRGLPESYGAEFEEIYLKAEADGLFIRQLPAATIWKKICDSQISCGLPYIMYKDHINRKSNHSNIGTIKGSNLCVAPETQILTAQGWYRIDSLVDIKVNIWNGLEWSETVVRKTGENQKLLKVTLSNGVEIDCTEYHRFPIIEIMPDGVSAHHFTHAKDLSEGMNLIDYDLPVIEGDSKYDLKYPYNTGLLAGDGIYYNKDDTNKEVRFTVPINASISNKMQWFSGLCDADGHLENGGSDLVIVNPHKAFLQAIRLMLQTVAVNSTVKYMGDVYSIVISNSNLGKLLTRKDFSTHELNFGDFEETELWATRFVKIQKVEDLERQSDTYCFTEIKRSMGMFNGILLGNCAEIVQYTSPEDIAVCNLANICLPYFATTNGESVYDYKGLGEITELVTVNLNRIIDYGFLPIDVAKATNDKQRAIGIGIQGLQEVMYIHRAPWGTDNSIDLSRRISETIDFHSTSKSAELGVKDGSYHHFEGSLISQGILQCDLWEKNANNEVDRARSKPITNLDWNGLRERVKLGMRNSLTTAYMPTAATAQIMGNTESFECATSNMYSRKVLAGEFPVTNRFLYRDLDSLGLWTKELVDAIIADNGSIQNIEGIPPALKELYRTVWEIKQKIFIDLSLDRSPFISQTQSLNLHVDKPTIKTLSSMQMYAWKHGIKTGCYYMRSQAARDPVKFTLQDLKKVPEVDSKKPVKTIMVCTEEVCTSCQ